MKLNETILKHDFKNVKNIFYVMKLISFQQTSVRGSCFLMISTNINCIHNKQHNNCFLI